MPAFRRISLALSILGVALFASAVIADGTAAASHVLFGTGLALGMGGAILWAASDAVRIYAIGHRDGVRDGLKIARDMNRQDA